MFKISKEYEFSIKKWRKHVEGRLYGTKKFDLLEELICPAYTGCRFIIL
jgi:hypothetical protein